MSLASRLPRRIRAIVLVALSIVVAGTSLIDLPWFTAKSPTLDLELGILGIAGEPSIGYAGAPYLGIAVVLATVYFFGRMLAFAIVALIGGPLRKLAWRSPASAQLQGVGLIALVVAESLVPPELRSKLDHTAVAATIHQSFGVWCFVGGVVIAFTAIGLVAHDRELCVIQGWDPPRATHDDVPAPRRERPMLDPSTPTIAAAVDASPFRTSGAADLASKLVKTAREPEPAKIAVDRDAPRPKLLD